MWSKKDMDKLQLAGNIMKCPSVTRWTQYELAVSSKLSQGQWVINLSEITDSNLGEWLIRMRLSRAISSAAFRNQKSLMTGPDEKKYGFASFLGVPHLQNCIGMTFSCKSMSQSQWLRHFMKDVKDFAAQDLTSVEDRLEVEAAWPEENSKVGLTAELIQKIVDGGHLG